MTARIAPRLIAGYINAAFAAVGTDKRRVRRYLRTIARLLPRPGQLLPAHDALYRIQARALRRAARHWRR